MYLVNHFVRNYGVRPEITNIMNRLEFVLVPFVNPDGYVVGVVTSGRCGYKCYMRIRCRLKEIL
jgi:murein tripeptide amidase MpaA